MPTPTSSGIFGLYRDEVRQAFASGMGVEASAFGDERLTIVDRPGATPWYTAMVTTFGTGTVISVDPAYRDVVERNQPSPHYRAHYPEFLAHIVDEGERRGDALAASSPALLWTLARLPDEPPVAPGLELRCVDADWMAAEMPNRRFENGVGRPGESGREVRNHFACALFDEAGQPVAVGGAFDTFGLCEIGVDVLREYRGQGLAAIVVAAVARAIADTGKVPLYGCAATNIRSQHTALSVGFKPVASDAFVMPRRGS